MNQTSQTIRTGLIGAGYIASWHGDALLSLPGVELTAVCDTSRSAAEGLAQSYGAQAFTNVEDLIASKIVDAVHVLTPPQTHCPIAVQTLGAGLHTLVEKPAALNAAEVAQMREAATSGGATLAIGHNFLALPAYMRLKDAIRNGHLGKIAEADVNWRFPLTPLRSGPYNLWMLREQDNLLKELGPHLYAFIVDLFGPIEVKDVRLSRPITLPDGTEHNQSMRVLAQAGAVDVAINLSLVEGFDDRSLTLRGTGGMARLDFGADTLIVSRDNTSDIVINAWRRSASQSWQHIREGTRNAIREIVSLNRKTPYGISFLAMASEFYDAIRQDREVDSRFSAASAEIVLRGITETTSLFPPAPPRPPKPQGTPEPTVLVIGGTGFIGRELTHRLVDAGYHVRIASRGSTTLFDALADKVELHTVSLFDPDGLVAAMKGIDTVFNLAKGTGDTWEDCLSGDIAASVNVAEAVLASGVRRLIYTGTIASFDMSDPSKTITDDTPLPTDMSDRNLYARSKAEAERRLLAMHETQGLPVVIARPGIVVGPGGPLQHWGLGRWHGAGAVRVWGRGTNPLPFVLNSDVADGLILMMNAPDIEGRSFNLVADTGLSARDYFAAIADRTGAVVQVAPSSLRVLYLTSRLKYLAKTYGLRRKGLSYDSLVDWKSRAHLARFDNSMVNDVLGWTPIEDRSVFFGKAIPDAEVLGL